eukprot:scaffold291567_cov28-Tisochrysis_lutea.AAC.1
MHHLRSAAGCRQGAPISLVELHHRVETSRLEAQLRGNSWRAVMQRVARWAWGGGGPARRYGSRTKGPGACHSSTRRAVRRRAHAP